MIATIPSLWPDINVELVPPLTILRAQANRLGQLTKGILEADVTTVTGDDDFQVHRLDIRAPSLGDRRVRALTTTHRTDYYPVVLEAECFRPRQRVGVAVEAATRVLPGFVQAWPNKYDWRPIVKDQDEFLKKVAEVLRSMEVRSAIESMIALSNEKNSSGVAEPVAS